MSKEIERYKQSETVTIKRSQIKFAPYNPRKKNPKVVAELKKNFKRVGYLGGVVWNVKTGFLVSGHKRIEAMDLIHGYTGSKEKDYSIKVERINVEDKTEREQNIFMNSQTVQGEFDMDMLATMIPGIDYSLAGLDESDITLIESQSAYDILGDASTGNILSDMAEIEKPYEERKEAIKQAKQQQKKRIEDYYNEGETYFMVSFDSVENKVAFLERFGFNPDDKYIKGEVLDMKTA
jgi:hypothetical protein